MYAWLPKRVKQAQQVLKAQNVELVFKFDAPASQDETQRCEAELGFVLPHSYKEFLQFSNGASIFCSAKPRFGIASSETTSPWWADSGILIQSTSTIVPFNQHQDVVYVEDDGEKKYIAFCYLGSIGTGDFCSFDITTYVDLECKVLDCDHDRSFEEWQADHIIADSFEDWLIQIFDEVIQHNGHPEYWFPSPLQE